MLNASAGKFCKLLPVSSLTRTAVTSSGTTYTDVTGGTIKCNHYSKYNNSKILIIPNITVLIQDSGFNLHLYWY